MVGIDCPQLGIRNDRHGGPAAAVLDLLRVDEEEGHDTGKYEQHHRHRSHHHAHGGALGFIVVGNSFSLGLKFSNLVPPIKTTNSPR